MRNFMGFVLLGVFSMLVAGCGEKLPSLAAVSGTLVANGKTRPRS